MGNGLVFLLRGRKLSGGARSTEAPAGRSQWQVDGQPPAGAGQTASHGLPLVVLHLPVCTAALCHRYVPLIINTIVNVSFILPDIIPLRYIICFKRELWSCGGGIIKEVNTKNPVSLYLFQHLDRNTEDHGSLCSSALLAWTAAAFCKLFGQSSRCSV